MKTLLIIVNILCCLSFILVKLASTSTIRPKWFGINDEKIPEEILKSDKVYVDDLVDQLKSLIENEEAKIAEETAKYVPSINITFIQEYHRYEEILSYVDELASNYSTLASIFDIGKSYEGRKMILLKIRSTSKSPKKGIFIDAGIHAREWIAPAACLYIITSLLTQYESNPKVKQMVDEFDWYFVPSVNPDGYEYTWTTDRLWRKTRSHQQCDKQPCCVGVDPNRNWNYHWGESGSSNDPCSEMYHGPEPFSEPETNAMAQMLMSLKDDLLVYISLHAYGQLWLLPYGYKENAHPPNFDKMLSVAKTAEAALERVHGVKYKVENAAELYPASGASDDWVKAVVGVEYAYTIELRPGNFGDDNSDDSFILPADQIIPTGQELFAGLLSLTENV